MRIAFFVSSGERFIANAPAGSAEQCYALPKQADRIGFWRGVTGDDRIAGHILIWEPVP